jgi:replicative DNA helicase
MNARHAVRVHGAKIIFLDYVQIVEGEEGDKAEDTRKRVERASKAMRQIAKELEVCVICLAQLNRKALERAAGGDWRNWDANAARPRRGDLRETAAIEMDADAIVTIHRPEILFKQMKPFETATNGDELLEFENELRLKYKGSAELSVLLNRSGPDGVLCDCRFRENIMRFELRARTVR